MNYFRPSSKCIVQVCGRKATGTQWIDHEPGVMEGVIEILPLYSQHLQNVFATASNWQGRLTFYKVNC